MHAMPGILLDRIERMTWNELVHWTSIAWAILDVPRENSPEDWVEGYEDNG